jgi:3'-phosphoadenosine 5'-phosphosulfate sulfotransferase (PAPS reductase)/FAD synthetase
LTADPFLIQGPALISFSGGRTSAYMLWRILQAHGGQLPADIHVCFANTGKERDETLRFVHECGSRWGIHVHWLEWRNAPKGFEEVGFNSASRQGEPFAALIAKYGYPPHGMNRFCTGKLKIRTMTKFARSLGWERWNNPVGLRYDEGHRVLKQLAANETSRERFTALMPLSSARVTKRDVMAFWMAQPFDLGLLPGEGNCDLCFLKGRATLMAAIRQEPSRADWWIEQEAIAGRPFNEREPMAHLAAAVRNQPGLFDPPAPTDEDHDTECGLICAGED